MGRALQKESLKKQKRLQDKAATQATTAAAATAEASSSSAMSSSTPPATIATKPLKIRTKKAKAPQNNVDANVDGAAPAPVVKKAIRRIRREKVFERGVMPTKKFRRAPFVRLTKAMVADISAKEGGLPPTIDEDGAEVETQMRISKPAFDMAQALVERYVSRLYRSATEVAKMSGKVTLKPQMLTIALKLSQDERN